ncbi:hypothetical protein WJX79_001877 [Trebouxia sp. C0005]
MQYMNANNLDLLSGVAAPLVQHLSGADSYVAVLSISALKRLNLGRCPSSLSRSLLWISHEKAIDSHRKSNGGFAPWSVALQT